VSEYTVVLNDEAFEFFWRGTRNDLILKGEWFTAPRGTVTLWDEGRYRKIEARISGLFELGYLTGIEQAQGWWQLGLTHKRRYLLCDDGEEWELQQPEFLADDSILERDKKAI
jgi:hypothetical protein